MKSFVILLCVLLVLLVGIGSFLILQFDPNLFRTAIEQSLRESLGVEPKWQHLSIPWGLFWGLRMSNLELRDPKTRELLLNSREVIIGFQATPLLRRRFRVRSLSLKNPELFFIRRRDGTWIWPVGLKAYRSTPFTKGERGAVKPWFEFVKNITLKEGRVHFLDEASSPPFVVNLYQLELKAYRPNFNASFEILGQGNFFKRGPPYLSFKATVTPGGDFFTFDLNYKNDTVRLEGQVGPFSGIPRFEGKVDIQRWNLAPLVSERWKENEHLVGKLSGHWEGTAQGTHPGNLKQTAAGKAIADIRQGVLKNINFINEIIGRVVGTTTFLSLLHSREPSEITPFLKSRDTPFEILQARFQLLQGTLYADEVRLKHAEYLMEGRGNYGLLDHSVQFQGKLVLLENLSEALTQQIDVMNKLKNERGRVVIPFTYEGNLPDASIQPTADLAPGVFGAKEEEEDEEEDED